MELTCIAARSGRLSSFLKGELNMSTGLINRLKRSDRIRVNGIHRWMNYEVSPGDRITVSLEDETPEYPAQEGALDILYEDTNGEGYLHSLNIPAFLATRAVKI